MNLGHSNALLLTEACINGWSDDYSTAAANFLGCEMYNSFKCRFCVAIDGKWLRFSFSLQPVNYNVGCSHHSEMKWRESERRKPRLTNVNKTSSFSGPHQGFGVTSIKSKWFRTFFFPSVQQLQVDGDSYSLLHIQLCCEMNLRVQLGLRLNLNPT